VDVATLVEHAEHVAVLERHETLFDEGDLGGDGEIVWLLGVLHKNSPRRDTRMVPREGARGFMFGVGGSNALLAHGAVRFRNPHRA
jgi:hypothetical protein